MKPLEGMRIIDFTAAYGGPLATMLLADHGAEVIKIEKSGGEMGRRFEPLGEGGGSGQFAFLNRGKKSVIADPASEEDREKLIELIRTADAVTENFTAGVMEGYGLGYDRLRRENPRIVYASLSGYGRTGERKDMAALDLQIQSMSGLSGISGYPDSPPVRAGAQLACHVAGTYMAMAVVMAVIHAEKTGCGQRIDISALDSVLSMIEAAPIEYTLNSTERERTGNSYPSICPYDTFDTKDGSISIGVSTDRQWELFCSALGMKDLAEDPRYKTNETRGKNYKTGLRDMIQEKISAMSRFEVEALMNENRIPCGIVYEVDEAMKSEQVRERRMLMDVEDHNMGTVRMPGKNIKFMYENEETPDGAPLPGEHTRMYLKEQEV